MTKKGNARKGALVGSRLAYDDTPSKKRKAKSKGKGKTKMKKKKGVAMKEEKVDLFGGITVKQGALHNQLKTKKKFGKAVLDRLAKIEIGKMFSFRGNKFKMTGLMKKRIGLAKAFAGMKKK